MPAAIQQRCWNHELREAVCRCLECSRSYCRECVTEHEGRLLCSACIRKLSGRVTKAPRRWTALALPVFAIAAFLLNWLVLYGLGASIISLNQRVEQQQWRNK